MVELHPAKDTRYVEIRRDCVAGIDAIVGDTECQVNRVVVEEAPPPSSEDVGHHCFSRLVGALIVARLIPALLRGGDGARLGLINEGMDEARGGCLTSSRGKKC